MRPLIGISCGVYPRDEPLRPIFGISQSYTLAVERAGGMPVLVPPQPDHEAVRAISARLDGLLLPGGGDIDPTSYGEERLPICGQIEPQRDALEIPLAQLALEEGKPILGICRGMQLLNVATGGTLYQDITAQRPNAVSHPTTDYRGKRDRTAHTIEIQPGSLLASIMGTTRHAVNSFHHQAVKQPGSGIEMLAWSEDGLPEGMVVQGHPFALAVQFHPEELTLVDPASQRLFNAFVRACADRMQSRQEQHLTPASARTGA
jgi:putative glutamine amidotransferase